MPHLTVPSEPASHDAHRRRRSVLVLAAVSACAGLAFWVSMGALAVTGAGPSASRVGLLPPAWVPALAAAGVLLAGLALRSRSRLSALAFTAVLLLPWLPLPVPDAFLAWTGPLAWWVWAGALVALLAPSGARRMARVFESLPSSASPAAAVALAFVVYCGAAWQMSAVLPGGDEPHYLVITQSLLSDGDIQIENNHRRGDYRAYFQGTLRPDFLRRGQNRQIYSIHAPGLSALAAPAFAVGGYPGVVIFLALVSALGGLLVWLTGFHLTGSRGAAWFGWAAVTLTVPFFFHAFAIYPDATGAALVMTGVLALAAFEATPEIPFSPARWALHGLALAVLPWLHTRYALAAGLLGACLALRLLGGRAWRSLAAFLAVPVASALAWFSFFFIVYGRWSPATPYGGYTQSKLSNIPAALPALLLDQQFGVLPNAPVYVCGLIGLAMLFRLRRRLAVELSLLLLGYLAAVSAYHMWWGGWSAPARFAVPVLLMLGVPAAVFWKERALAGRAAASAALTLSLLITASMTMAQEGWLVYNTRDGFARWLEWVSPLVDLPHALPAFLRDGPRTAILQAALWAAVFAAAAWALSRLARSRAGTPARVALATPVLVALAVMAGLTANWALVRTTPVTATSAQLALLRAYDPGLRPIGIGFQPLAAGSSHQVLPRLRIGRSTRRPAAVNDPMLTLTELPAGAYALDSVSVAAARGDVEALAGRGDRPFRRWMFEPGEDPGSLTLDVPVALTALTLRGDERARATIPDLVLRPVTITPPPQRIAAGRARRAVAYDGLTVFAFDDLAYLEEPGLWVPAGEPVRLIVMGERRSGSLHLLARNGPVENEVRMQSGAWSSVLRMGPREERLVEIPVDAALGAALLEVRTEQGFRPAETEPGSTDTRYLGVWLEGAR